MKAKRPFCSAVVFTNILQRNGNRNPTLKKVQEDQRVLLSLVRAENTLGRHLTYAHFDFTSRCKQLPLEAAQGNGTVLVFLLPQPGKDPLRNRHLGMSEVDGPYYAALEAMAIQLRSLGAKRKNR